MKESDPAGHPEAQVAGGFAYGEPSDGLRSPDRPTAEAAFEPTASTEPDPLRPRRMPNHDWIGRYRGSPSVCWSSSARVHICFRGSLARVSSER